MTAESRLVLFKPSVGSAFGVVVDRDCRHPERRIQTESSLSTKEITQPANVVAGRVDLIDSVCQLADELLVVLNPRRFLAVVEQGVAVDS